MINKPPHDMMLRKSSRMKKLCKKKGPMYSLGFAVSPTPPLIGKSELLGEASDA